MTAITSFWKCLPLQTPDSFPFAIDDEACVAQVRAPHTLPAGHTVTSPPGCAMCRVSCTHPQAARLLVSVQRLQRAWQVCAVDSERAKTPPALYQSLGCKLVCGDVCSWHALVLACGLTPPPLHPSLQRPHSDATREQFQALMRDAWCRGNSHVRVQTSFDARRFRETAAFRGLRALERRILWTAVRAWRRAVFVGGIVGGVGILTCTALAGDAPGTAGGPACGMLVGVCGCGSVCVRLW